MKKRLDCERQTISKILITITVGRICIPPSMAYICPPVAIKYAHNCVVFFFLIWSLSLYTGMVKTGSRLNIMTVFPRETVFSLQRESTHWQDGIFVLRQIPECSPILNSQNLQPTTVTPWWARWRLKWRLDCLLHRMFKRRSKKTSKLRVTGLCDGNPSVIGGFPSQRASDAEMFPLYDVIMSYPILALDLCGVSYGYFGGNWPPWSWTALYMYMAIN